MTSLTKIENILKTYCIFDPTYKTFREKTTNLHVLGLRLPVIQRIEQTGFWFYDKKAEEIFKEWDMIWNHSQIHEVMYLPLFYYRRHKKELSSAHWKTMKTWINRVENWEHADLLCYLYSILYEKFPTLLEPTFKQWNCSKNSWKRRASIVSTIYYASKNRKAPSVKFVLSLIKPLIQDKNSYVQKAVGWQLREAYQLWPEEILIFLRANLGQLSAITFSYATEKLSIEKKDLFKKQRRSKRSKQKLLE